MYQNNQKLNIAFFGTPELCIPILEKLSQQGYTPNLIITNPDRPVGRKQILTPSPVKVWGQNHHIPVQTPEKLNQDFYDTLNQSSWDIFIVVAYGKIIPERIIHIPKHGTLNIHYSLLPRWRGASPVEAALLHNDTETGVCIQNMVYELDAGDVLALERVTIQPHETTPSLRHRLNQIGAELLARTLPQWIHGSIIPKSQDVNLVTTCTKISKSDGEINTETMTDQEMWNRYRAYDGWPGIFYFDKENKRIKITKASFANNTFIIEKVIPEGKKEIDYTIYLSQN